MKFKQVWWETFFPCDSKIKEKGELKVERRQNQEKKSDSQCKETAFLSFPEYEFLTSAKAVTADVCSCCVAILYSKKSPEYVMMHFNSEIYLKSKICPITHQKIRTKRHIEEDFNEIHNRLKKNEAFSSFRAILIGGGSQLFNVMRDILTEKGIEIAASYLDDSTSICAPDDLLTKEVCFNREDATATIVSPPFQKPIILTDKNHLTLENDFPEVYASIISNANDLIARI